MENSNNLLIITLQCLSIRSTMLLPLTSHYLSYVSLTYCIQMLYVTWLVLNTEQMSDVQMCMRMLLLLVVRAVGGSDPAFVSLSANGCFCIHGERQIT